MYQNMFKKIGEVCLSYATEENIDAIHDLMLSVCGIGIKRIFAVPSFNKTFRVDLLIRFLGSNFS